MKTINGKNKLERQINKAIKYCGVNLKEVSNKYLKVEKVLETENVIIQKGKIIDTKYGIKVVFDVAGENFWINEYNTIKLSEYHNLESIFIIKLNDFQKDKFIKAINSIEKDFKENLLINNLNNKNISLQIKKN